MGESSQNGILFVDETYLLLTLFDEEDEIFPISDEKYAEELHLQEALMSAAISNPISKTLDNNNRSAQRSRGKNVDEKSKLPATTSKLSARDSRVNFCPICMDDKPAGEMFRNTNCTHSFCTDCMGTYISTRIRENISGLNCPDPNCTAPLDPTNCHGVVPKEVILRWEDALCEATILASEKFIYCPFKNCGALLVDDDNGDVAVVESECPSCHRLFCAKCKVPWHGGLSCGEFKSGGSSSVKFDEMAAELARKKKWKRCPKCKFYVEKKDGCNHITCRCRYQFCYACGDTWKGKDHDFCSAR